MYGLRRFTPIAAGLAVAAVSTVLLAQKPPFRSATRLVRLDVTVLDRDKQPVRNLTVADFQILERGKPLVVRSFDSVAVPGVGSIVVPQQEQGQPDEQGFVSLADVLAGKVPDPTRVNPARLIALVMDDDMTPANPKWGSQAKAIARSIVEQLGPNDRMAIQFTRVASTRLEFSKGQAELLAKVNSFSPGGFFALRPSITGADEVPRYRRSLDGLSFTIDALAPLTDRQKVVVYVGPGVPIDQLSRPGTGGWRESGNYHNELVLSMARLFEEAERANVVVYTFDPTGKDGLEEYAFDKFLEAAKTEPHPDRQSLAESMDTIRLKAKNIGQWTVDYSSAVAENTGGRAFVRSEIFEPAVAQMFADTSFYYLIAVDPVGVRPDGRFHEVTVKVNRRNVDVRARRGYYYNP